MIFQEEYNLKEENAEEKVPLMLGCISGFSERNTSKITVTL